MRSPIRVPMLAILLVAATAMAVEPPIVKVVPSPPPAKWQEFRADVGQRIWLSAGKPAVWVLANEGADGDLVVAPNGGDPSFAASKAGRYHLVAFVEGQEPARVVVAVGDAQPGPGPSPGPDPPPVPPGPKADKLWLVVIEETGERTPAVAKVLNDGGYWSGIIMRGHKNRFYDKDSAEAKSRGYVALVASPQNGLPPVGVPALILIDQATGKPLKVMRLPADTAGVDAAMKEVLK